MLCCGSQVPFECEIDPLGTKSPAELGATSADCLANAASRT